MLISGSDFEFRSIKYENRRDTHSTSESNKDYDYRWEHHGDRKNRSTCKIIR